MFQRAGVFAPENLELQSSHEFKGILTQLYFPQKRSIKANKVESLLKALGFDQPPKGKKSALEHFKTAHLAYESPFAGDNPVSTSLIPLRECINLVIGELLRRRPAQEPAKNERAKIISIGVQLRRDEISPETIQSWSQQWWEITNKELGGAKQQDVSREEWRRRLMRGTEFLYALLSGLDSNKMRR